MKTTMESRTICSLAIGVFTLAFVWCGCQSTNETITLYTDFPVQKELKAVTIELDTAIFRYPFRMRAYKDKMIVMDLHNADYYYHLFRFPDFEYISSFGKRGEAPTEMLVTENFRYVEDNQQVEVWTLDSSRSRITRLGFSVFGNSLAETQAIALDKNLLRPLDFCLYEDSVMIIPDYSGENRFCFVGTSGRLLRKYGQIPTSNQAALDESKPALSQAWRSFIDYNPREKVLVAATQLGEVIEIYNFNDSTYRVIMGPNGEPEYQEIKGYAIPSGIMGFSDLQITDNHIYVVFHGRKFEDMIKDLNQMIDGGQYIYVFNLKGEPVCKYMLDRYVNGLYVDEAAQRIYATDVNNDQPLVYFAI